MSSHHSLDVSYVAKLSRIHLNEEEKSEFSQTLTQILDHIEQLQKYDIEGVIPTSHAVPTFDRMREDVAQEGFGVQKALLNAPQQAQDQIKVPKVVETA